MEFVLSGWAIIRGLYLCKRTIPGQSCRRPPGTKVLRRGTSLLQHDNFQPQRLRRAGHELKQVKQLKGSTSKS